MTTRETFLSLAVGAPYPETAAKIDFDALDSFVAMFIIAYMNRRGAEIIREELTSDSLSETTTFLTRLIDVGTVQFLSENYLISANEEETNDLAAVVAHCINISMASELQLNGLDQLGGNIFFGISAIYGLIARVISHINDSRQQEGYIFSLVSLNLVNFVNDARVE
jgi:hypothetical protein